MTQQSVETSAGARDRIPSTASTHQTVATEPNDSAVNGDLPHTGDDKRQSKIFQECTHRFILDDYI